jgi:hypothetical protein
MIHCGQVDVGSPTGSRLNMEILNVQLSLAKDYEGTTFDMYQRFGP